MLATACHVLHNEEKMIAITLAADIHTPLRVCFNNFGDPRSFSLGAIIRTDTQPDTNTCQTTMNPINLSSTSLTLIETSMLKCWFNIVKMVNINTEHHHVSFVPTDLVALLALAFS